MIDFPPIPPDVKHIAHYLKVADEHDDRNFVVSYWCRMYACQVAMKTVPGKKSVEVTKLLVAIMDWLELAKKEHLELDGVTNDTTAQALIEQYAIQLFQYADAQDLAEKFGKNVVKAFYTAGILMDVLQQFGELSEDIFNKRKYAKWKAAYIHNCLKNGEKPLPGPPTEGNLLGDSDEEEDEDGAKGPVGPPPGPFIAPIQPPSSPFSPPPVTIDPTNPAEGNLPSVPQPYIPAPTPPQPAPRVSPVPPAVPAASGSGNAAIGPEEIEKAQKYCKYAGSALTYDDVTTAIENLQKALHLLQFGIEM